jgi:plasmid stabilization system protein ParE
VRQREVFVTPEAKLDLAHIRGWLLDVAGPDVGEHYFAGLEKYILGLGLASERGTRRYGFREGVRIVSFKKSATIAFIVGDPARILERGRLGAGIIGS